MARSRKSSSRYERKLDTHVQTWIDGRYLATALEWYYNEGQEMDTTSELVRNMLEDYARILVRNGARRIDDTQEANELLTFRPSEGSWMGRGRTERNYFLNRQQEEIEEIEKEVAPKQRISPMVESLVESAKITAATMDTNRRSNNSQRSRSQQIEEQLEELKREKEEIAKQMQSIDPGREREAYERLLLRRNKIDEEVEKLENRLMMEEPATRKERVLTEEEKKQHIELATRKAANNAQMEEAKMEGDRRKVAQFEAIDKELMKEYYNLPGKE